MSVYPGRPADTFVQSTSDTLQCFLWPACSLGRSAGHCHGNGPPLTSSSRSGSPAKKKKKEIVRGHHD